MDRKAYLMNMRQNRLLKGQKPCFISLKQNIGKIYNEGSADFIMSYRDGVLYFQRMSFFFHNLKPKLDFELHAGRFTEYKIIDKTFMNILYLYDKDGNFIDIYYQTGRVDTISTEDNISRILEMLGQTGLKMVVDE